MSALRRWLAAACCVLATGATAHPLAPALLEVRQLDAGHHAVLWRTTAQRVQVQDVIPRLPDGCTQESTPQVDRDGGAIAARWTVSCPGELAGRTISLEGLSHSVINVIVRIEPLEGATVEVLLDRDTPSFTVPAPAEAAAAVPRYFGLGVAHLLTGWDHMLFVAGLFLLVAGWRRLLLTVTAFTLGHSATLALATLGVLRLDPLLAEAGIAVSILVLASELASRQPASWLRRQPWHMAGAFGLLHGLGFAGALAQVGLPQDAIAGALLGFNLGIEAGQLAVILALAFLQRCAARVAVPAGHLVPAYVIGSLAAFWLFERIAAGVA